MSPGDTVRMMFPSRGSRVLEGDVGKLVDIEEGNQHTPEPMVIVDFDRHGLVECYQWRVELVS